MDPTANKGVTKSSCFTCTEKKNVCATRLSPGSPVFAVRVPDTSLRAMVLLPGDLFVRDHGVQPRHDDGVAALVDRSSALRVQVDAGRPARPPLSQRRDPPVSAGELVNSRRRPASRSLARAVSHPVPHFT